MLGLIKESKWV